MPAAKKLIEVALPLDAISDASAREKNIRHGHPSTLHLWWARRPLAAARAVIFASLVDDPEDPEAHPDFVAECKDLRYSELASDRDIGKNVKTKGDSPRMRLFDFIEHLVQWESTSDEKIMGKARQLIRLCSDGQPPPLLDPFAGGGSIPLEAQRLGLEAHASDLNPVAVMINKAMLEIPPRFAGQAPVSSTQTPIGDSCRGEPLARPSTPHADGGTEGGWRAAAGLAADVRHYGQWMRDRAEERIGHLYPQHKGETVIAWLWARTVMSPNPAVNAHVPLVSSFVLSKKKGRERWAKPIVEGNRVRFEIAEGTPPKGQAGTMIRRQGARCLISGEPFGFDYIRQEGRAGRMGQQLMAIVTAGKKGRSYYSPDPEHETIAESAKPKWTPVGKLPKKALGFSAQNYGMDEWNKLFTARQLTALTTLSDLVVDAREKATKDALKFGLADDNVPLRDGGCGAFAYAEAISVYLAFAVDKYASRACSLCLWEPQGQRVVHIFGRQTISMAWDYPESNTFADRSIHWMSQLEWVARGLDYLPTASRGHAAIEDAANLSQEAIILSTDPPYYDNVGYADLSDFYYVWLRRSLRPVYPDLLATLLTPKSTELIASPHRHSSKQEAKTHFEKGMRNTFHKIRRSVNPDYPLTIYYAFKQQDAELLREGSNFTRASTGWETMLTSLIDSGFQIVGTWPLKTERKGRMRAQKSNALASSIVLVCRPRPADAPALSLSQFRARLRRDLPAEIAKIRSGNILPVDLAQAAIGPGMALYSQYRAVRSADGRALSVREALGMINTALDESMREVDADLDSESRFALGWFEQHGWGEGDFGDADVMARARNTSVDSVVLAGVAQSLAGKVRLLHFGGYDAAYDPAKDERPIAWEAAHHMLRRLEHGEEATALLYNKLRDKDGKLADAVPDLAYLLHNICDRQGWNAEAGDYNGLISSWTGIMQYAEQHRQSPAQQRMAINQDIAES